MRAAIVLPERHQDRAALTLAIGAVALQALDLAHDAVDVRARLLDLAIDLGALRRLAAENRKEAAALAAHLLRLLIEAIEVGLLLAGQVLVTLDLGRLGRIEGAAVERGELAFVAQAGRVARGLAGGGAGVYCCGVCAARDTGVTQARISGIAAAHPTHRCQDRFASHEWRLPQPPGGADEALEW